MDKGLSVRSYFRHWERHGTREIETIARCSLAERKKIAQKKLRAKTDLRSYIKNRTVIQKRMIAARYGRAVRGIRFTTSGPSCHLASTEGYSRFLETPLSKEDRKHAPVTFSIVRHNQTDSKVENEGSEPTLEMARAMGTGYKTIDNSSLLLLAALDSPPIEEARGEVLKRHIMR